MSRRGISPQPGLQRREPRLKKEIALRGDRSAWRLCDQAKWCLHNMLSCCINMCVQTFFRLSKPPGMHYVYIIVSVAHPGRYYVGLTENVRQRLAHHNQGIVRSTAPFRPWRLRTAICFSSKDRAAEFEQYLKTGSGIAFLR